MKIFATNYLEPMSEDIANENEWTWNPENDGKGTGPGRPTKTMMCRKTSDVVLPPHKDSDMPAESPSGSMLVA